MNLKYGRYFIRWRRNVCLPLTTLAAPHPRVWTASRIAIGISATIFLATLNNTVYGDSSAADSDKTAPSEDAAASSQLSLIAGFTADKSLWQMPIRYLGEPPPGINRMYWFARFDTRFRIISRGPRTLLNFFEGEGTLKSNISDILAENLWFNLEGLFSWYQIDHSSAQPVEHLQEPHPPPDAIHSVIKTAVKYGDESVLKYFLGRVFSSPSKKNATDGIVATSASCMISALYEDDGRPREPDAEGLVKYDLHVLSEDHTPSNPAEKTRVEELHPGEDIIENGALLDRPYTRALGDGKLKWAPDVQAKLHKDYLGAPPDPRVKTPPYISAEPDVSTIKVLPGDFLVMTSHWVGECLTDEEVVGLVGAWLNKHGETHLVDVAPATPEPTPPEAIAPRELPVDLKGEDKTVMYRRWNVPKRFINVEPTPTAHIAYNAMGGADTELREALLQLSPAASEGNVKAIGVAVVFFQ
ncbi:phosphatase 2C-domain-containing protein [Mycena alexandri]|uniref:Phosphatase 2C-domain-containing protein n=1 Tax=Mycena alexandri TaxID=1745969 RepID=A0AAD6SSL3_9AGAR|nr:phosphatase 2C-domain-containing protein [Mycena alexandri]